MENFNTVPSQGKFGDSVAVVNENFLLAQQEMEILRNLISPDTKFVTAVATAQTTSVTQVLPATGSTDTVYRVGKWDGTQYDATVYSEYAWFGSQYKLLATKEYGIDTTPTAGSDNLITSGAVAASIVYDISAAHSGAAYADLAAALGTNGSNVPDTVRKGGMSVKFIQGTAQSSDNMYVQYRLMADEWTTNTKDWAIAEEGVYVMNPEFIYVKTDANEKLLDGIKKDGTRVFGGNVIIKGSVKDGDNKTLISSFIDNPVYKKIITDADEKIVEGIKTNGDHFINGNLQVNGKINSSDIRVDYSSIASFNQIGRNQLKSVLVYFSCFHYSMSNIKLIIDTMSNLGLNCLHLGIISINCQFVLNDMTFEANGETYDLSSIEQGYTEDEVIEILEYARYRGIDIIPTVDSPGHLSEALRYYPEFSIEKTPESAFNIDLHDIQAQNFAIGYVNMYLQWFKNHGCRYFNFGCDEYYGGYKRLQELGDYEYANYINKLLLLASDNNIIPFIWNDPVCCNGSKIPYLYKNAIVQWWTPETSGKDIYESGYNILMSPSSLYFDNDSSTDIQYVLGQINGFDPFEFTKNIVGTQMCIWRVPNDGDGGSLATNNIIIPLLEAYANRLNFLNI